MCKAVRSVRTFYISKNAYNEMIAHCLENLPLEACGLISGEGNFGFTLWKLQNEAKRRSRFSISKESVEKTLKEIGEKYEVLTGIFHSHPNTPAVPSARDIAFNPYPDLAYFIVSFRKSNPEVGCFIMKDKIVEKLELVVLDEKIEKLR